MSAPRTFSLTPGKRVLYLTKDPERIRRQLAGELTLRSGGVFGRAHIVEGRLAWVQLSSNPVSLPELVWPSVPAEDLRAVLDDCRSSGRNFCSVLV